MLRVVSVAGAVVAIAACLGACSEPRLGDAPAPVFVYGERAAPTPLQPAAEPDGGGVVSLDAIEPDAPNGGELRPNAMFTVDDAGNAQPNASAWDAFDAVLRQRLVPANSSASVAVMVDGRVVHTAAYGERVPGSGEAVDTTDRFRIASISKTITAIVAMSLVDDGILTLDDPIGATVAEHLGLTTYDPDVNSITVRHLLSHTAGFGKHQATFFSSGAASCSDAAKEGLRSGVSAPGSFTYSNMSYCVLGVAIEAVTGMTYERVVSERLLTPLGISGMRFTGTYEIGPDEVSHSPTPDRNFMETLGAAGSWNATPTDLVTILNSIDPTTDGWKALSPEAMEMMRYRDPAEGEPAGYGLGLINYGGDAYGHTGTIENTHAMVLVQPNGVTWAVTVAGDYPSETDNLRSILNTAFQSAF